MDHFNLKLCFIQRLWLAFAFAFSTAVATAAEPLASKPGPPSPGILQHLTNVGPKYRFAIVADPQVGHASSRDRVEINAKRMLEECVRELNAMADPAVAFVVFLGDFVNVPDDKSWANFCDGIANLRPQCVYVHGNHDTRYPYTKFREVQREHTGFEAMYYSFDAGDWHFVVLPDNLGGNAPEMLQFIDEMLVWLEQDLAANAERPTIVFHHRHIVPGGLSQLEFYTHPLWLRKRLWEMYHKHGNVRYHFNGHVHNGVQPSLKMARQSGTMRMITVPTIIAGRPFGEELEKFAAGADRGGYYLLVDVEGEDVTITARLTNSSAEHVYDDEFPEFTLEEEPRWWKRLADFPAKARLENGSFENGLQGWLQTHRYRTDDTPGYEMRADSQFASEGVQSAYVATREKGQNWANDEYTEIYQFVDVSSLERPHLTASYFLEGAPTAGGGWIRLAFLNDSELLSLLMFRWGEEQTEAKCDFVSCCFHYSVTGSQAGWLYLQALAEKKRGLYLQLPQEPDRWHRLAVDLAALYDQAVGKPGAFAALGATKAMIGLGTYCHNPTPGAHSAARFDSINVTSGSAGAACVVNGEGVLVDDSVFKCYFGQARQKSIEKRQQMNR